MANDLKLLWHPDFGAVLCIEGDSGQDINKLLSSCPFTERCEVSDVRYVNVDGNGEGTVGLPAGSRNLLAVPENRGKGLRGFVRRVWRLLKYGKE